MRKGFPNPTFHLVRPVMESTLREVDNSSLSGSTFRIYLESTRKLEQKAGTESEQVSMLAIMAPIAHGLTAEQISAVAAYASYLE